LDDLKRGIRQELPIRRDLSVRKWFDFPQREESAGDGGPQSMGGNGFRGFGILSRNVVPVAVNAVAVNAVFGFATAQRGPEAV